MYTSIDGTDMKIFNPTPFDTKWFPQKWKGQELRYEIAISIQENRIVCADGPFSRGSFPDQKISLKNLSKMICPHESIVAD